MRGCLFRIQTDYSSPEGTNEGSGAYNVTYGLTSWKQTHKTSTVKCSCAVCRTDRQSSQRVLTAGAEGVSTLFALL